MIKDLGCAERGSVKNIRRRRVVEHSSGMHGLPESVLSTDQQCWAKGMLFPGSGTPGDRAPSPGTCEESSWWPW